MFPLVLIIDKMCRIRFLSYIWIRGYFSLLSKNLLSVLINRNRQCFIFNNIFELIFLAVFEQIDIMLALMR